MTDRELLELAAKAADYIGRIEHPNKDGKFCIVTDEGWQEWNPLIDDGDALRLAVVLGLNINFEEFNDVDFACAIPRRSHRGWDEVCGDDPCAATRRAIVRAAAAIGSADGKETT